MDSIHPLIKSKFGILEPNELAETVDKKVIDLLIVPGLLLIKTIIESVLAEDFTIDF